MHQPVEDGVGERGLADRGVPLLLGNLAGDNGRAALVVNGCRDPRLDEGMGSVKGFLR